MTTSNCVTWMKEKEMEEMDDTRRGMLDDEEAEGEMAKKWRRKRG